MDKYKQAIIDYAVWQKRIKQLKSEIRDAALTPYKLNDDGGGWGGEPLCTDMQTELTIESYIPGALDASKKTCVERLWEFNKAIIASEFDDEDAPALCISCATVQKLVDERKEAKRRLGIEKRRISALGRALI